MNKIIITRMEGRILTMFVSGQRAVQLNLEEENRSILGNIYIGKVKNIAKNINSAFIDLGGGSMAYYSLSENKNHLFADRVSAEETDETMAKQETTRANPAAAERITAADSAVTGQAAAAADSAVTRQAAAAADSAVTGQAAAAADSAVTRQAAAAADSAVTRQAAAAADSAVTRQAVAAADSAAAERITAAAPAPTKPGRPQNVRPLRPGDDIVVQVSKDAVKTKEPVVTSCISFTGRYCVITAGRRHIGFSSKITDGAWKSRIRQAVLEEKDAEFGVIVRTNAAFVSEEDIIRELRQLKERYYRLLSEASYRTCYTLLHRSEPSYIGSLRDAYMDSLDEVVTDDAEIFSEIRKYLSAHQPQDLEKARLYEDSFLPLGKLYSIDKAVNEAMARRVWLKSGGYLVIDPTEAMTVIDVNSGKYAGKKAMREAILKINLEAAREAALQLRLRNLSGIILIDFIDMEFQEDKEELMELLASCCKKDPVKTTVVDMTRLGLVEVTRKKIRKPFREQMQKGDNAK